MQLIDFELKLVTLQAEYEGIQVFLIVTTDKETLPSTPAASITFAISSGLSGVNVVDTRLGWDLSAPDMMSIW